MFEDWLDILQRGSFEASLPAITVTSGEIGTHSGTGHVSWNEKSGIRIQAVTQGGETITKLMSEGGGSPGRLIPHDTFITFSGLTQDGWELTSDPISRDGHRTDGLHPDVVWDVSTTGITLQEESEEPHRPRVRILMGPIPPKWIRKTETEIRNDAFRKSWWRKDWLSTTCSIGEVSARQRSDDWFEVLVVPKEQEPMRDVHVICTAITRAFGFMLGRRCVVRGYQAFNERIEFRRLDLRYPATTTNTLLQPIGRKHEFSQNAEHLLGLAIDFFLTPLGEQVSPYLYLCWDSADNAYITRLAISSICLEGLMRVAAKTLGPTRPQVDPTDLSAFQTWLETKPAGFTQQSLNRLGGLKHQFQDLSLKEIFRDWTDRGVLGVTQEDLKAWSDTRNPFAHGRLAAANNQDVLQTRVDRHSRIQNLLNKIFLQMMSYTGQFIDYGQPSFPPATFPAFENSIDVVTKAGTTPPTSATTD